MKDKNILYYFKHIDIFGTHPLFTIRGNPTFQTFIGAEVTLICIISISCYIYYFLIQMINHENPTVLTTINNEEVPQLISLTKKNFTFAIGLQDPEYNSFVDETIYKLSVIQNKAILNKNGSVEYISSPIKIITCDKYKFEIVPEYFQRLSLSNLYCIDSEKFELEGEYKSDIWSYVKLNFSKCINSTLNNYSCRSEQEIKKILKGGYIGIFISDYNIDPNSFNKPYRVYGKNIYSTFSSDYFSDIFLYLKRVEIQTDSGYLFPEESNIKFAVYDHSQNEIDYREAQHFLSLTLRLSSKVEVYKRTYIKLQTIFSNVGGMIKIILLFGEYSIYIVNSTLYKNYILEFFNLDESEIRLKQVRKMYKIEGNKNTESILNSNLLINHLNSSITNKTYRNNYMNPKNSLFCKKEESPQNIKIINCDVNENENNNPLDLIFKKKNYSFTREIGKNLDEQEKIISLKSLSKSPDPNSNAIKPALFIENNTNIKPQSQSQSENKLIKISKINNTNVDNNNKNQFFEKIELLSPRRNLRGFNKKNKLMGNTLMPNIKIRAIKVPGFFTDFVCKKNTCQIIKQVHQNYKEIQFLLDIVHYLKTENKISIFEKLIFTEEQRINLSYIYSFESGFDLEKKGYEHMIKHKINKKENE